MKSLFSIIITTKNEEKNIQNCLESIKHQIYPRKKIEIIVVDNHSKDKTIEIAKKYTNKVYSFGTERSAQRNYGMLNKAKGKYVIFVDADMILTKDLISQADAKFQKNPKILGLYIPLRWKGNNWIIKAKGFEREFYDATCLDAVRIIQRETFKKIGGFDDRLYAGEDWDLDKRVRQIGLVDSIKSEMWHFEDEKISLINYIKKMKYYSKNMNIYQQKWGKSDLDVKRQFGFSYRFLWVFLENGNWKKVISHPVLFIEMYLLKIMVGLAYIFYRK